MFDLSFSFCAEDFKKNNWDASIPKSVKSPVKWVVLTTAFEILVTNEFWSPIENKREHISKSGKYKAEKLLETPIKIRMKLAMMVGKK